MIAENIGGVGVAFDGIAQDYDRIFTDTLIGRAQRDAVWAVLMKTFKKRDNILELNCGTGEDAIFLGNSDISVFAGDASSQMIARAEERLRSVPSRIPVTFCELPIERIGELRPDTHFDGAFSNFSGLNCVTDLEPVAFSLARLVKPGGHIVLCFSTRFSLIESVYFLTTGRWRKAARRWKGHARVQLANTSFTVYYPTVRRVREAFAPGFRMQSCTGVGVAVPPSYLEPWAGRHPAAVGFLRRMETMLASLPILRVTGDHVLLCFEREGR